MLTGARLAVEWHHARAHRCFSAACWSADQLGLALLGVRPTVIGYIRAWFAA